MTGETVREGYEGGYRDGCEDGYSQGVSEAARHAAKQERILRDLIVDLRDQHHAYPYVLPLTRQRAKEFCGRCQVDWPCLSAEAVYRAEARLKEVQGE